MKPQPPDRAHWAVPLFVALITVVAFLPALDAGFVSWDDDKNFIYNLDYRGLGEDQLTWMWTTFHLGHYVPLSWMSLGLDYELWGMDARGYHATNLLLHAANAVLVYYLARRLLAASLPGLAASARQLTYAAALAALLFAVHPLRVESVAWVTERRDVLSLLFCLGSVMAYLRSVDHPSQSRWHALSLLAFVCALLSKGTSVTVPAVLLILNVHPLARLGTGGRVGWTGAGARRVYLELAPFVALAAATSVLTLVALQDLPQLGVAGKLAVSAYSLAFYIWKTLLPSGLAPLYAMPSAVDPFATRYLLSAGLVVVATGVAWLLRQRWPGVLTAWLLFLATIAPMLGIVQNGPQIAADRYTYLPSLWISMLGAGLVYSLSPTRRGVATGVAGLAVAVLAVLTWRQTTLWQDSRSMWAQVLAVEPDSPIGNNNMGNVMFIERRYNDAVGHYRKAIAHAPKYSEAHNNLGVAYTRLGRHVEALDEYDRALRAQPTNDNAHDNWGIALDGLGREAEALPHFEAAVRINRDNLDARVNWGNALLGLGRPEDAIRLYKEVVTIRPSHAKAHLNWGVALARQGLLAGALEHFRQAVALDPTSSEAATYLSETSRLLVAPR